MKTSEAVVSGLILFLALSGGLAMAGSAQSEPAVKSAGEAALESLKGFPGSSPRIVPALGEALKDADPKVRSHAGENVFFGAAEAKQYSDEHKSLPEEGKVK